MPQKDDPTHDEPELDEVPAPSDERERPSTDEAPPRSVTDEVDEATGEERGGFFRFTRKLMDRKELSEDAWKVMGSVLATSDKAKSDFIRMLGREVRHYLDGLQLTDDVRDLVTSHSLEVRASLHLKPLTREQMEPRKDEDTPPDDAS